MKHKGEFYCSACRQWLAKPVVQTAGGTGYAIDRVTERKVCYACCAVRDMQAMRSTGQTVLYAGEGKLTNWPGTLALPIVYSRVSRHNIARTRVDYWFTFEGNEWHGVRYGDNTDLVHCKRTKARAA